MLLDNKRILIIKPSSLGDIVHTLPVTHAIKRCFPQSTIGWIVQQAFAPLLHADDSVDEVFPIHIPSTSDPQTERGAWIRAFRATTHTLGTLRKQFQRAPYDLILDLHASFRSGLLGLTNPGGQRAGFSQAKELNTFFQDHLIQVPKEVVHAQEKNLLFCSYLGIKVIDGDFYLCTSIPDRKAVQKFLQASNVADNAPVVYANPAARWQTKFWPIEYWAALTDKLHHEGISVVFGGSPQDREYLSSITRLMKSDPIIAAGNLTLPQSAALIQRASLYIGLDSGPMHIAALARTPVVALFGPTHPDRVGPYSPDKNEHRIVRAEELDCLECRKRSCSHLSCMKRISPEHVYSAACSLLYSRPCSQEDHQSSSKNTPSFHEG